MPAALSGEVLVVRASNARFRVSVIVDRCKDCGICIHVCPKNVLVRGQKLNKYGFRYPEPVNIENCIGCRMCEYNCPDFAIFVEELRS